mmetsp:Transcript_55581/g.143109  ORF Transcript_55581/g.143109 Transcript_55581/m.143109 type:complete len:331 (-) Transcript_55581:1064-2056(-)
MTSLVAPEENGPSDAIRPRRPPVLHVRWHTRWHIIVLNIGVAASSPHRWLTIWPQWEALWRHGFWRRCRDPRKTAQRRACTSQPSAADPGHPLLVAPVRHGRKNEEHEVEDHEAHGAEASAVSSERLQVPEVEAEDDACKAEGTDAADEHNQHLKPSRSVQASLHDLHRKRPGEGQCGDRVHGHLDEAQDPVAQRPVPLVVISGVDTQTHGQGVEERDANLVPVWHTSAPKGTNDRARQVSVDHSVELVQRCLVGLGLLNQVEVPEHLSDVALHYRAVLLTVAASRPDAEPLHARAHVGPLVRAVPQQGRVCPHTREIGSHEPDRLQLRR